MRIVCAQCLRPLPMQPSRSMFLGRTSKCRVQHRADGRGRLALRDVRLSTGHGQTQRVHSLYSFRLGKLLRGRRNKKKHGPNKGRGRVHEARALLMMRGKGKQELP